MVFAEEPAFLTTTNPSPPMKYLYLSIRSAAFYRCANTPHREAPSQPLPRSPLLNLETRHLPPSHAGH